MVKAIRFEKTGGSDVLQYVDLDLPAPAAGQVQVRHTAIGVNFIDTYHRTGLYALPLPSGLGSEAAGTVAALGEGVTGFSVGDRVGYSSGAIGSYAEANNVPATKLVKLPAEIVWVHVAVATLLWVGIVLAAVQAGSPLREPARQGAEHALGAAGAAAPAARP